MKNSITILLVLMILSIISCKDEPEITQPINNNVKSGCFYEHSEIYFADSCTYAFAVPFVTKHDSVSVEKIFMGESIFVVADSSDYTYWENYFKNDPGIAAISKETAGMDSLVIKLRLTGEIPLEQEETRISSISHLTIRNTLLEKKYIVAKFPDTTYSYWERYFYDFDFVNEVGNLTICADYF